VILLLLLHYIYNPFNNLFYIDYAHCVRPSSGQVVANSALGSQSLAIPRWSYSHRHIGHTHSNGYFKLVDTLLQIHSGFFPHSI